MTSAIDRALSREWFYSFQLPDGRATRSYLPDDVATIHETRLAMIESVLDSDATRPAAEMTCLDLACHEGFFAVHMAQRGFRDVLGIDVRPANIEGARLMREIYGLSNLRLEEGDVATLDPERLGEFDLVLVLGLIPHLPDPVGALRIARALTRHVCMVETQIDSESLSVPSADALLVKMRSVGFAGVEVVTPPEGGNDQFARGTRVMVCGWSNSGVTSATRAASRTWGAHP